jgi:two-component system response regulator NreC
VAPARGGRLKKIRVLIADDHGVVRRGLRLQLEQHDDFEVVGEASDGREAITMLDKLAPDIIIMDIAMPNLNGIQATAQIVKKNPQVGIIVLSMHSDETYLTRTLAAGAKGYLLKDNAEVDLERAVRVVAQGKPYFSPAIANTLLEDYMRQMQQRGLQDSYDLLTEREKEILQLLAEGKTNKDVAQLLNLSPNTVETHRTRLMQKLDLHSTAEIVLYAVRKQIISYQETNR